MSRIQRDHHGQDQRIVILPSRAKLALMAVGSLVFVAGGVFMVSDGGAAAIGGVVGIVFFGACGAYAVWRLVAPSPLLVIDRQGIHDNGSALGSGRVPWSEITGCGAFTFGGQRMVGIGLVDPAAHLARLNPVKRRAVQTNMELGYPPVLIPQNVLPLSGDELVEEIETFRVRVIGG